VGGKNARIFNSDLSEQQPRSERVVWAGFVTDGELKALYENAGCLVFPSLYEGFGLPPLEAMYCGCPVVASSRTSIPEVCGDAALYCDATSANDIAEKISLMMTDDVLRQRYKAMGYERAREFRWDMTAQAVLELLKGQAGVRVSGVPASASAG